MRWIAVATAIQRIVYVPIGPLLRVDCANRPYLIDHGWGA